MTILPFASNYTLQPAASQNLFAEKNRVVFCKVYCTIFSCKQLFIPK